jgi:hypothetical protein
MKPATLLLAALASITARAGVNQWTPIGPFGGSASAIAIDPQDPSVVYAATTGGINKSIDAGGTWRLANSGIPTAFVARALIVDPRTPSTLYAGGAAGTWGPFGMFKSTDSAATWSPLHGGLDSSVQVVDALAIDPQNSSTLYLGATACLQPSGDPGYIPGGDNSCFKPGVFKSTDAGATWTGINRNLPWQSGPWSVSAVAADPQNSGTLYAAYNGLFKSTDGGLTWTASLSGANAIAIAPGNPSTLYAIAGNAILKSTDAGVTWTSVHSGCCQALAVDPRDSATIYAASSDGVIKSIDAGQTWQPTPLPSAQPSRPAFFASPTALVVDPLNGALYVGTNGLGIFKSTDRAATWIPINQGISATEVYCVLAQPGALFASTSGGLFKSINAGASWTAASGLPTGPLSAPSLLAADLTDPHVLYAGILAPASVDNTLFQSADGGSTWTPAGLLPDGASFFGPLAVDPLDHTVFAGGTPPRQFGALFSSSDRGATWTSIASFGNDMDALAIDPQNPSTIYAAFFNDVLMKSSDHGATWTSLAIPLDAVDGCDECNGVNVVAVDPQNSGIVYAAGDVGLLRSTDAGATWTTLIPAQPLGSNRFAIVIDPKNSANVYIASAGTVLRSSDRGDTWRDAGPGLTAPASRPPGVIWSLASLVLDPNDPSTLYAGTTGGGVFAITFVDEPVR